MGMRGPRSNVNEGILHILQIFKTGASKTDGLMSYLGHSSRVSYPSAENQSVYSTSLLGGLMSTSGIKRQTIDIRCAFNKFPDLFCTSIYNCYRLLKIQYVIVIDLMR